MFRRSKFPKERISIQLCLRSHFSGTHQNKMAASASKAKCANYDGKGDVNVFLTKVELVAAIKGHANEKKAQFVASKLSGPAFDVYMRLSDEHKRDFDQIKEQLKKEFERGQLNREEAIHVLSSRHRKPEESPETFSYKIKELVKLAYPTFADGAQKTLAKDYFMRGIHPDMQVALKAEAAFETNNVDALAKETVRLELAGIKSFGTKCTRLNETSSVNEVSVVDESIVESIANKVIEKLNLNAANAVSEPDDAVNGGVSYVSNNNLRGGGNYSRGGRGQWNNRGRARGRARGQMQRGNGKCRGCGRGGHFVRVCPERFCQACGNQGHDQYNELCPKYHN